MSIIDDIITTIDAILLKVFNPVRWNKITAKLELLLQQTWNEQQAAAIEEAIKRLVDAGETFSSEDAEIVMATLEEHLGRPMSEILGEDVATIQRSAYEQSFKDIDVALKFGKKDQRVLRWLEQDALYWIESYYEREVRDQLQETMTDIVSSGESRLQAGMRLQEVFGDRIRKDNLYWEGLSNHITTRTREFAKVSGYLQAGITFIEIRAVLDGRTTQVCRYMHGRVFKVKDAKNLREKIMEADTPEAIKKVAPWLKGNLLKRMKTEELVNDGVVLPPYHWNCRTTTVMWDEETIEGNEVDEMEFGSNISTAKKNSLKVYTEQEYSNWIRDFRDANKNIDYSPDDIDQDMKKHAKHLGFKNKGEYIETAKKIVATSDRILAQEYSDGNIQFFFYGDDESVVCVDTQFFIRGLWKPDHKYNFDKSKLKRLWLRLNKKN